MAAPANNGPMTVLEILNRTKVFFERKGVPDPLLDAQHIISFGLGMKNRMDLYLNFEKPLTPAELDTLRPLVARRANREPLQHIIGDTSFRGFIIKCDPRALIPRSETEDIVDMVKNSIKDIEAPFVVEIGTGSGCIAISCAKEIESAKVLACDVSEDALALARENATANELESDKLTFAQGDLLNAVSADVLASAGFSPDKKIDCLVANLPYIPDSEKGKLQPEVDKFDPALALYGGADGLDLVRKLLQQTEGRLSSGAMIFLEIGSEQAEVLKAEAASYPWLDFAGIHKDYCDNIRFVSYKNI
ncbi:MAG: peptide chain release factor N(5)-glutamine methyltransferase [Fibrobacter sp.]|nr:peptide chain release factor N(5)-glutamine methyltransferase [Fibrobacter sp.]